MYELEMNGQMIPFNFGMGFLRQINKTLKRPLDGIKDATENVGLRYMLADIVDGSPEAMVEVLFAANNGLEPRITKQELDDFIDNPDTDIEKLFEDVKGFLSKSNATKNEMKKVMKVVEEQEELEKKMQELLNQTQN